MSDAKASNQDLFSIALCSQCLQPIPPSTTREVRHAVPCGHVFCKDCLGRVESEQKSGESSCRRTGCERELAPVCEFAPSWVARRTERVKAQEQAMFPDQGNVGDLPPPACSECEPDPGTGERHLATHRCETCGDGVYLCAELVATHPKFKASRGLGRVATRSKSQASRGHVVVPLDAAPSTGAPSEPAWGHCTEHKLPFKAVEAATHRPMCSMCLLAARRKVPMETFDEAIAALESADAASISTELTRQKVKLAEPTCTPEELCARVSKWGAEVTARIRAWEEREVKQVQAVANETVQLVQEVCARRTEVGASVLTQRMGLRASLEELDRALADLPSDPAARLSKQLAVYADRKRLCELLAGSKITVPWPSAVTAWAELPTLSAEFDQTGPGNGGVLANGVSAAAMAKMQNSTPPLPSNEVLCEFPVIPKLDPAKGLRSILMGDMTPKVFVGLDEGTVVVGFEEMSPLQVWDLAAGKLVREFEGKGDSCYSMINLSHCRIAVVWDNKSQFVVAVFDAATGKQLQELTGSWKAIIGMALVEDHLLTLCFEGNLRVWGQDAAGKFIEKYRFAISRMPVGAMTVLSPSTVAIAMCEPAHVEVWDWKVGRRVESLVGFSGNYLQALALLPDGRLVAGDDKGTIRVGLVNNWDAATVIVNADSSPLSELLMTETAGLISVLAGHDGSFVTTDTAGNIKLWRNGACEVTLTGEYWFSYRGGRHLAVIGRRLIAVGDGNLLVAE